MAEFELIQLKSEHLDECAALSAAIGWPHRSSDWEVLLPFSTGIAAQQGNKIIGTALRSDFGADLSTLNMVIVAPELRGQGLGRALVSSLLQTERRNLRLVSTVSGMPLYEKLGFKEVARLAQHQGEVKSTPEFGGAQDASTQDLPSIRKLESQSYGGDRTALIDWIANNARLAVVRRDGDVTGFAACRLFGKGHMIGPVVAREAKDAKALISHHLRGLVGQFVRLDVTRDTELSAWLVKTGLLIADQPPVMERGAISASPERVAVFSQALG